MKPPGLDYRTLKEIEWFLKEKQAKLKESLRRGMTEHSTNETGRSADSAVWATESLHDEIQVALIDRYSDQVAQIEAALDRLARREYGVCQDCGESIGLARLRAMPFTERCRHCQARAEFQARRQTRLVPAFVAETDDD